MTTKLEELYAKLDLSGSQLAHFGTKGMRWGIRKSEGGGARTSGAKASKLHDKSTVEIGHRRLKRVLGDGKYWKTASLVGALEVAAVAGSFAIPGLAPVAVLGIVGSHAFVVNAVGLAAVRAGQIAGLALYAQNVRRNAPGQVKHAAEDVASTVQEVYNSMTAKQKDAAAVWLMSHVENFDISNDAELKTVWDSMSDEQTSVVYFLTGIAMDSEDTMEQTAMTFDDILAHFGTKGMKWGVRKDALAVSVINKDSAKAGQARIDYVVGGNGPAPTKEDQQQLTGAIRSAAQSIYRKDTYDAIAYFNKGMREKLGDRWSAETQKGYDEHIASILQSAANRGLKAPVTASVIPNKNGDMILAVGHKDVISQWEKDLKHSLIDAGILETVVVSIRDEDGFIIGFEKNEDVMKQTAMTFDDILTHFGVKGMRWGVRRSQRELGNASKSSESPDAIRARETLASIRSNGSTSAVSDADLRHLLNRIDVEKKYTEAMKTMGSGQKSHNLVKTALGVGETMNKAYNFVNSPAGKVIAITLGLSGKGGKHLLGASKGLSSGGAGGKHKR